MILRHAIIGAAMFTGSVALAGNADYGGALLRACTNSSEILIARVIRCHNLLDCKTPKGEGVSFRGTVLSVETSLWGRATGEVLVVDYVPHNPSWFQLRKPALKTNEQVLCFLSRLHAVNRDIDMPCFAIAEPAPGIGMVQGGSEEMLYVIISDTLQDICKPLPGLPPGDGQDDPRHNALFAAVADFILTQSKTNGFAPLATAIQGLRQQDDGPAKGGRVLPRHVEGAK